MILNNRQNVTSKGSEKYDVIIVGAGPAGTYAAYRLRNRYSKILILEKSNRIGGRLWSLPLNHTNQYQVELGGMRFFKQFHSRVTRLINELDLTPVSVPYISNQGVAYIRNQYRTIGDVNSNNSPYDLPNSQSVQQLLLQFGQIDLTPTQLLQPSEYTLLQKYTHEQYRSIVEIGGYSSPYSPETATSVTYVGQQPIIGHDQQYFVKEGYQEIPQRLFQRSGAQINFNTSVRQITAEGRVNTDDQTYQADKIILAMNARELAEFIPTEFLYQVKAIKIFLEFEEAWWNLPLGRSVTDLPLQQLWYYGGNTLMIYADEDNAEYWANLLPQLPGGHWWPYQKRMSHLWNELSRQIKLMLQREDIPLPKQLSWKFWEDGWNFYRPNVDLSTIPRRYHNAWLVGSDISTHQAWVEGALETVDNFLTNF